MKHNLSAFGQLLYYAGLHKAQLFLAILCSSLNALCNILPEVFAGLAIDVVLQKDQSSLAYFFNEPRVMPQLYIIGVLTIFFCVLESLFEYCYLLLWKGFGEQVQHDLRVQMYSQICQLEMAFHENETTGSILSILNEDVGELDRLLKETINRLIQLVVSTLCIWLIFFYLAPSIAVLALIPIPFVLIISFYFQHKLAPIYKEAREHSGQLNGRIANTLMGIAEIKSYTAEEYELDQVKDDASYYRMLNRKATLFSSAYIPLVRFVIMLGFIMTLIVGGWYVLQGQIDMGAYSILVFLMQKFLWPFAEIAEIADVYEKSMASARRVFGLLSKESEIKTGSRELVAENVEGSIRFENVSFEYEDKRPVLHNISCQIPAGKTVAFVGASDSGKSTLSKLLLRFYDLACGSILLDGIDIRTLNLQDLRKAIGLVSQDAYLFHGTIAENIGYGTFNATPEDILHAAKIADAHDFIMGFTNKYETTIGERGQKLSSGQRQKISIARSILKNAAVVVFDQATSSLDTQAETLLHRWVSSPEMPRTLIIITQHLISAKNADIIFVLDKGEIVESGTHDQLLKKGGVYEQLWHNQRGRTTH